MICFGFLNCNFLFEYTWTRVKKYELYTHMLGIKIYISPTLSQAPSGLDDAASQAGSTLSTFDWRCDGGEDVIMSWSLEACSKNMIPLNNMLCWGLLGLLQCNGQASKQAVWSEVNNSKVSTNTFGCAKTTWVSKLGRVGEDTFESIFGKILKIHCSCI